MNESESLAIGELAERGGVSRRTVRYYVQRGLLPAPAGRGRGEHYRPEHLEHLLRIKAWQEQGLSLEAIAVLLSEEGESVTVPAAPAPPRSPQPAAEVWTRLVLARGVELHVAASVGPLDSEGVRRLAEAARELVSRRGGDGHG